MSSKKYTILFIILALLFVGCKGGKKGQFRLSGSLSHMQQGELYIYCTDPGHQRFDTIKVNGGEFKYQIPLADSCTLHLIWPNYSQLHIKARSGQLAELKGDANALSKVSLKGTDRAAAPWQDSTFVTDEQLLLALDYAAQDSTTTDTIARPDTHKQTFYIFWANWMGSSSNALYHAKKVLDMEDDINVVSFSLDPDTMLANLALRQNDYKGEHHCDRRAFEGNFVRHLGLQTLPYFILTDSTGHITAQGDDYQINIEPTLTKKESHADKDK